LALSEVHFAGVHLPTVHVALAISHAFFVAIVLAEHIPASTHCLLFLKAPPLASLIEHVPVSPQAASEVAALIEHKPKPTQRALVVALEACLSQTPATLSHCFLLTPEQLPLL
jgi:hypothetical protein